MKRINILLVTLLIFILAHSLHLSSNQHDIEETTQMKNTHRLYYPKHYIGHRSAEYKQKVREQNLKKIEAFNNNNRKKLRSIPGDSSTVTGGNSFVMGETKFIEFTQDEFIKLFTGLKRSSAHQHHLSQQYNQNHEKSSDENAVKKEKNPSQQKFNLHLMKKINPQFNHDTLIEEHYEQTLSNNQINAQSHRQSWTFFDPYAIDDGFVSKLYGNVNSDDNWGWDWMSLDKNYYKSGSNGDFSNYWSNWENDHWGKSWDSGNSWFSDWSWIGDSSGSGSSSNSWWNSWGSNQSNDNWWNSDSWFNFDKKPTPTPSPTPTPTPTPSNTNTSKPIAAYPKDAVEVNWAKKGATTHIKEQGQCGSCWTYSAVGVIESYFLIKGMGKMDLSEQQLVDCQKKGCYGCDGGQQNYALQYAVSNGLVAQEKYPYRGFQQSCVHKTGPHKIPKIYRASGRAKIEEALRKGPVTAAIYVDDGLQFYQKGIFDRCVKGIPNHAVVLVGFTKDYWIIRNSWGTDWGEDGHIRIKKDQNNKNACSIQNDVYGVTQL